jgi:hypothetical protein
MYVGYACTECVIGVDESNECKWNTKYEWGLKMQNSYRNGNPNVIFSVLILLYLSLVVADSATGYQECSELERSASSHEG